ncbi:MAG TPA: hypothetical protein VFV72_01960 [Candidatus Limnocylindrales bacterium]|nr:hypothetical protein [Candidatus Limnocylindrales bacterium]
MTDDRALDRSIERAARSWLEAGPTRAPEHAVTAALERIDHTTQERGLRTPRRFRLMTTPARLAAAAVLGAVVLGGTFLLFGGGGRSNAPIAPSPSPTVSPTPAAPASAPRSVALDYSNLPGSILAEHLGNAMDGTEQDETEYNPDRRRLYLMDPSDMTAATTVEFLPGQPATGKSAADVSFDSKRVVFQDWADQTRIYEANLDGTGLHKLPVDCDCALLYPDYDPTATKVVYVRIEGIESWLDVLDLASGQTTRLEATVGPPGNSVPEQPAWSPDGKTIAFSRLTWREPNEPVVGTVHYGDVAPTSGKVTLLDLASGTVRDLPIDPALIPGDVQWSPDSATILFTAGPGSTTGSVAADHPSGAYRISVAGGEPFQLGGWGGPIFTPDGQFILYQDNVFYLMRPNGSDARPVNQTGADLSELNIGFAYIGHWIDAP